MVLAAAVTGNNPRHANNKKTICFHTPSSVAPVIFEFRANELNISYEGERFFRFRIRKKICRPPFIYGSRRVRFRTSAAG